MFPSTITITVASGQTRVLSRVNQDNYGSEYRLKSADETIVMKIRHSVDSVDKDTNLVMSRHNVYFDRIVHPTPTDTMRRYTTTFTMREDQYADPAVSAESSKGITTWLESGTILADLAKGVN